MKVKTLHPARYHTPWIGREAELQEVTRKLDEPGLFVFVGPPGAGKTRFAIEVCEQTRGGVAATWLFVDVTEARSSRDVTFALEAALRMAPEEEVEPKEAVARVASALSNRGIKRVVLDNFEGAVAEAGWLPGELASVGTAVTVVVTSRRALGDPRETRIDVAPLILADGVLLFLERSRRLGVVDQDDAEVRQLVERLDGLPLAIELAAGRTRILSVSEVLVGLKSNEALRVVGSAEEDSRHSSLSSALRTSWEALDSEEQVALRKLCCFRRGFEMGAAKAVLGADASHLLQRLDDKSLVTVAQTSLGRRFRLLVPIAEFVSSVALPDQATEAAHQAHWQYYEELGRTQEHLAEHEGAKEAALVFEAELPNLEIALERACGQSPAIAASLALSIKSFRWSRAPLTVGLDLLTTAVEQAALAEEPLLLVRALCGRAHSLTVAKQNDAAAADLEEAASHADTWELRRAVGKGQSRVAIWLWSPAELEKLAGELLREGVERNDRLVQAEANSIQAAAAVNRGDTTAALERQRCAMDYFRSLKMMSRYHLEQSNLAGLLDLDGDSAAEPNIREALAYSREVGDLRAIAHRSMVLGGILLGAGGKRLDEVTAHLERAVQIGKEGIGHIRLRCWTRYYLGLTHLNSLRFTDAETDFIASRMDGLVRASMAGVGAARALDGNLEGARRAFEECAAQHEDPENRGESSKAEELRAGLFLCETLAEARRAINEGDRETALEFLAKIGDFAGPPPMIRPVVLHVQTEAIFLAANHELEVPITASEGLLVGADAAWARLPDGALVDLRTRAPVRRLLLALAKASFAGSKAGLTTDELFLEGWPDEQADRKAAGNRVRVALSALRKLGFDDILERGAEGYRLSEQLPVQVQGFLPQGKANS